MPANHGQLKLLTPSEENAIRNLGQLLVAEIVKITWPSPDGIIYYAWRKLDLDPAYTAPLSSFLAGRPLKAAFIADDKRFEFHSIPRTSAISDDVVQMRFTNKNREFELLCYKHRGGARVEIFYFLPQLPKAISWWLGHLRTPDAADSDFVTITAASGFRSANLLLPNRQHASNCTFYFGGELTTTAEIADNPCDYDRHLGGSQGLLNSGSPFTDCKRIESDCKARHGDLSRYGGDDTVIETTLIGAGDHKTNSTTVGNESRLKEPKRVVYGKRKVRALHLLAFAKEFNPSDDHQDKGTLRTLFEVSEGRIKSISNVKVMDQAPQGLITKLGARAQTPTDFSPNVLSYNATAHFRANLNPIDPTGIQASQIVAECDVEGRDEIKVYSDPTTFTKQYTNNRAWCLLDLLTNQWFGHRIDNSRYLIDDFIYLAAKGSTFNADVQGIKTAQQQIYDICLAGRWYLPFNYNGKTRILPIEKIDTTQADIPVFSDQGTPPTRNILFENGVSRLKVRYKDDDKIFNAITLLFEDGEHENIEMPLLFEDFKQQYRAGLIYGDKSKRRVEHQYTAFGTTVLSEAVTLGETLLRLGPFGQEGGIWNNLEVEFVIDGLTPEGLNLHENKVVKVLSPKLTGYVDPDNNQFQYFVIKSLVRNEKAELIVTAQAYGFVDPALCCSDVVSNVNVPVTWICAGNFTVTDNDLVRFDPLQFGAIDTIPNSYAQSAEELTVPGSYFEWTVPNPGAELYVGIGTFDCPFWGSSANGVRPFFGFFYEHNSATYQFKENTSFFAGAFYTAGDVFRIERRSDGKIDYKVNGSVVRTSSVVAFVEHHLIAVGVRKRTTPSAALPAVNDAVFHQEADCGGGTQTTESVVFQFPTNFTVSGNNLTQINGAGSQNAFVQSQQTIANNNEYFEFQVPARTGKFYVGVTTVNNPAGPWNALAFTLSAEVWWFKDLHLNETGGAGKEDAIVALVETAVTNYGDHTDGDASFFDYPSPEDTWQIKLCDGKLQYLKNCQIVYESFGSAPGSPLRLFVISGEDPAANGLTIIANAQKKSGCCGQNLGSSSLQNVQWECLTNIEATGSALAITGGRDGFHTCFAQSDQVILHDQEWFSWRWKVPGVQGQVGLMFGDCPDCFQVTEIPGVRPAYCFWERNTANYQFYYGLDETADPNSDNWYAVLYDNDGTTHNERARGTFTTDTVFKLKINGRYVEYYVNDVLVDKGSTSFLGARLCVVTGPDYNTKPFPFQFLVDAKFGRDASDCGETNPQQGVGTSGGQSAQQTPVPSGEQLFEDSTFQPLVEDSTLGTLLDE